MIVLDNLAQEMAGVEGANPNYRAYLYLPPYSQDLNPIEQFFAKLKASYRAGANEAPVALR